MRYPGFLKNGSKIGLVAPSFPISGYPYLERFEYATNKLRNLGFEFIEGDNIKNQLTKLSGASSKLRAKEFMNMYLFSDADFIWSVAGGEIMIDMLPYIDFEALKTAQPKYFMGYSDNTNLTFTLPILTDTATIYGYHIGDLGSIKWDESQQDTFDLITGKKLEFTSYDYYSTSKEYKTPNHALDSFTKDVEVKLESMDGNNHLFSGRLIGGCLDCIDGLLGLPYSNINNFFYKYKEDGFIWFLEACDYNAAQIYRTLWKMKELGYFKYCNGFILGRPNNGEAVMDFEYVDSLKILGDLNVPIIYNSDIGHQPPSWNLIVGSVATIYYEDHKAKIKYSLI